MSEKTSEQLVDDVIEWADRLRFREERGYDEERIEAVREAYADAKVALLGRLKAYEEALLSIVNPPLVLAEDDARDVAGWFVAEANKGFLAARGGVHAE